MNRKKCLMFLLMCLGAVSAVSAVEVINIDFNAYNDDSVYTGTAAYNDGINLWHTYYGGWGVPMGSPRSAGLIAYNATPAAGTYAEQVWIADPGNHGYDTGTALLDDGFKKTGTGADPNVRFFGGKGAYGGTFDMYVYSDQDSYFSLKAGDGNDLTPPRPTQHVDGNFTPGTFSLGHNYVIFPNVSIGEPNDIMLIYSKKISAVQLVSTKTPTAVQDGTVIDARNYDVAFDTNARAGEITLWGPDIGTYVSYLDANEYMEYDITVSTASMARYTIAAHVDCNWGAASMSIYLDGVYIGRLTRPQTNTHDIVLTNNATPVNLNLFAGKHVIKCLQPTTIRYNDIVDFVLTKIGAVTLANCAEVGTYGLNYAGDLTGDCKVDLADLALLVADWANCYNPEAGVCN